MSVDVGSKAPDFTLMNQERQPVTLSQLKGKPVVLAFFPAAFSSVCEKELCTFRDSMSQLDKSNAQVLGISTDTFFALKAFHDQQKFNFPLLSDFNKVKRLEGQRQVVALVSAPDEQQHAAAASG